jgi:ArsR family transcriptional regulator
MGLMNEAAEFFSALGDEERLRIMSLLLAQKQGACVCELVDALRLPQYQVSRQLGILRRARIVTGLKRGKWVYYDIQPDLPPLANTILENLAAHLQDETAREDRERFEKRVSLRSGGMCVIGYELDRPYRDQIPLVEIETVEEQRR